MKEAMASIIFKALLFYGLFLFLRWVWRIYRMVSLVRQKIRQDAQKARQTHSGPTPNQNQGQTGDVIEAEYRVLDERD